MPEQILVAEDDDNLAFVLREGLERSGYGVEVVGKLSLGINPDEQPRWG